MLSILIRLFIKNPSDYGNPRTRQAYGILCGCVGIFLNLSLSILKFWAGAISNSIAITADAFNNLSDAASSLITLIGFKLAGQKPDQDHPFGHGRIEYLSGLFVAVSILFMAYELVLSSIKKMIHPEELFTTGQIILFLLLSIAVKLYIAFYNHKIGKRLNSAAMLATATDSLGDMLATSVVLISSAISMLTGRNMDGFCGVIVGLFIFYAGFDAAKQTISPLLGQPPEKNLIKQIEDIVLSGEHILGVHDVIVHDYGPGKIMVSLHAEVPASETLLKMHEEIDMLEHELKRQLHCEAVIHIDPVRNDDPETMNMKQQVFRLITEYDPKLSIHDFRIVRHSDDARILFDLLIPIDYAVTDERLSDEICSRISSQYPGYTCLIEIDRAYL